LWYNIPTMLPAGSMHAAASRLTAGNIVECIIQQAVNTV